MAWNPCPEVAAARDYGTKFGKHMVIILAINTEAEGGQQGVQIVTYGKTKQLCDVAKTLGDAAHNGLTKFIEILDGVGT